MKKKEILELLNSGKKLELRDYPFGIRYFIDDNQITKSQFDSHKKLCSNKDESQYATLRGQTKSWYYWV